MYVLCLEGILPVCQSSLLKHGQKSKVRTVLKSVDPGNFGTILTFDFCIFEHILPEINQIELTKDKKKLDPF